MDSRRALHINLIIVAAPQKKVFKVARSDRAKCRLPVVSVADAEAAGRRITLKHFGVPHEE